MSHYSDQLAWAAKEAQKVLAPMADPAGDGEFTLSSFAAETFTGTLSIFDKVLVTAPNGYEEQRQLKIAATREQFSSEPDPAGRPLIIAKGEHWRLTAVEPGAQFYVLTGVAA